MNFTTVLALEPARGNSIENPPQWPIDFCDVTYRYRQFCENMFLALNRPLTLAGGSLAQRRIRPVPGPDSILAVCNALLFSGVRPVNAFALIVKNHCWHLFGIEFFPMRHPRVIRVASASKLDPGVAHEGA